MFNDREKIILNLKNVISFMNKNLDDIMNNNNMNETNNEEVIEEESIKKIKELGGKDIRFLCMLAAPEGIEAMAQYHPDVPIYTASIDRCLDENAYIRPGLGDAGDRVYYN